MTQKVFAGAQPEGKEGFERLSKLGIKTIISVDGASPDVEAARQYGLRYVHLPIGYDGVKPSQGKQIAKAIEELPGPIYVHCHHGKHRSAAAVAVACVMGGTLEPAQAEDVLRTFGTGENYKGLWQAAREAKPLEPRELAAVDVQYVERAKIPATAEAMVQIDERWDHMKLIKKSGWRTPAEDADLDPPHEALLLRELIREMRRNDAKHSGQADFVHLLDQAETGVVELQSLLSRSSVDPAACDVAFQGVAESCAACHRHYRD